MIHPGEAVWYKKLKVGEEKNMMDSDWEDGVWLGWLGREMEL